MVPRKGRPSQGWMTFLRNNADAIAAIDMLSVHTILFQRLYAVVVLGHGRRRILHVEVTDHPTAQWLALQITEAFPWDRTPTYLVRDNDGAYGFAFRRRVRAMGVRDRPTMPRAPWQNGHVERVIGSIRRECLDHLIILNAAHLRRMLKAYVDYYNNDRTHLALEKDAPNFRPMEATGRVISTPVLGGLHRRYRHMRSK
jgi:transposase InsO family protein